MLGFADDGDLSMLCAMRGALEPLLMGLVGQTDPIGHQTLNQGNSHFHSCASCLPAPAQLRAHRRESCGGVPNAAVLASCSSGSVAF